MALLAVAGKAGAQTNFSIYADQLGNGFQDWSWGTHNFSSPSPVHSGSDAISFSGTTWEAISIWHDDFNPSSYTNLNFWINGGATGGQVVQIYLQYGSASAPRVSTAAAGRRTLGAIFHTVCNALAWLA